MEGEHRALGKGLGNQILNIFQASGESILAKQLKWTPVLGQYTGTAHLALVK